MAASSPSPRGFDSAEADEAVRKAARAEARRYRAEELTNAFPRREIPVGGCPAGARWSPSVGTCVAPGGSGISTNVGSHDMPLPTLVTLLLAVGIAGAIFVAVAWTALFAIRALARRARAAATAADTDKTKPTASFSFRALDTIARFVECLVEHLDERLVGAKGARRESATRATETETLRGDDDDETTPSGVRLGEAMGACLANLAREIDIELSRLDKASGVVTISAPRARAAAGEMASALTAYLEAGDERAADEFRATFADAAEKAFAETTAKTKTFTFSSSSVSEGGSGAEKSLSASGARADGAENGKKNADGVDGSSRTEVSATSATSPPSNGTEKGGWFSGFVDPIGSFTETFAVKTAAKTVVVETKETHSDSDRGWGVAVPESVGARAAPLVALSPDANAVLAAAAAADDKQLKVLDLAVRYREVLSSERANDIAEKHLSLNQRALETQRLNLNVLSEKNQLHHESNSLAAEKLEGDMKDRKLALEEKQHLETLAFIADAFYAGLAVVFAATLAGGWRRAVAALGATVSVCPAPPGWFKSGDASGGDPNSERRFSLTRTVWSYASGTGGPGPAEYAWCVAKSLVGAAWGAIVFALISWKLLQYNVVTRFQAAPATVLLALLGFGCGHLGRTAVDALGGDGSVWLRLWRSYLLFVAVCTWQTKWVTAALNASGPAGRFGFFFAVAVAAPFCVGAAPFEDVFAKLWVDLMGFVEHYGGEAKDKIVEAAEIIGFGFVF